MNEENLNEDLKQNNNIIVTFGELETDDNRNIKFPPEKAGKKIIKSGAEIWKEASDTITITANPNTAEIIKKLRNKLGNKTSNKEDIVH